MVKKIILFLLALFVILIPLTRSIAKEADVNTAAEQFKTVPAEGVILPSADDEKLMGAKELFDLGLIFHKRNAFNRSEEYYKKALTKNPNYTTAYEYLGDVYMDKNNPSEARKSYLEAYAREPENPELCSKIAHSYEYNANGNRFGEGFNDAKCVEFYKKAIGINQKDADSYLKLGRVSFLAGKFEDALPYLRALVKIKIDNGEAYYYLGRIYEHKNNLKIATEYYKLSAHNTTATAEWKKDLDQRFNMLVAKKK